MNLRVTMGFQKENDTRALVTELLTIEDFQDLHTLVFNALFDNYLDLKANLLDGYTENDIILGLEVVETAEENND